MFLWEPRSGRAGGGLGVPGGAAKAHLWAFPVSTPPPGLRMGRSEIQRVIAPLVFMREERAALRAGEINIFLSALVGVVITHR